MSLFEVIIKLIATCTVKKLKYGNTHAPDPIAWNMDRTWDSNLSWMSDRCQGLPGIWGGARALFGATPPNHGSGWFLESVAMPSEAEHYKVQSAAG